MMLRNRLAMAYHPIFYIPSDSVYHCLSDHLANSYLSYTYTLHVSYICPYYPVVRTLSIQSLPFIENIFQCPGWNENVSFGKAMVPTGIKLLSTSIINLVHPVHPILSIHPYPIFQICPILEEVSITSST